MSAANEHAHGPGLPLYFAIFAALMILTGVTVWVAYHDWGYLNNVVALSIASFKALLVILFFMHVYYEKRLITAFVVIGILWMLLMLGFIALDLFIRGY